MTTEIKEEDIANFKVAESFRTIVLEDMKIAARCSIPDRVLEDMMIDVIRLELRRTTEIYIAGVFRSEILQSTEKIVSVSSPEYPSSLWDCLKMYTNKKLHTRFKVSMNSQTRVAKVTFTRNAVYPHMPSLRKEYSTGRYVIKESISSDERQKEYFERYENDGDD